MSDGNERQGGRTEGFSTIILAAGRGTRMRSDLAKVLHPLCGQPMLRYPIAAARQAGSEREVVVIGHQAELIRERFEGDGLLYAEQREQLGTGHAVLQAAEAFRDSTGTIVILCGDVPLIRPRTIGALLARHRETRAAVTVLTALLADPAGYGRVVKAKDGYLRRIVEEKDASPPEREIREINTGIYCVESGFLFPAVASLGNRNAQREYYLTDIVEIAAAGGLRAVSLPAPDPVELMGINTPEELARAGRLMAERLGGTDFVPEEPDRSGVAGAAAGRDSGQR